MFTRAETGEIFKGVLDRGKGSCDDVNDLIQLDGVVIIRSYIKKALPKTCLQSLLVR